MRGLGRLACLCALAALAGLAAAAPAAAGAWTRSAGEGQAIVTTARRMAPAGALFGSVPDRDTTISQVYLEYGLIDGLTIGAKAYVELSTTDLDRSSAALGAFLRKRVWQNGQGTVAAVQVGYAHPVESLLGSAFAAADPGAVPEAHLAALYGRGWGGGWDDVWGSAFVSTGAAYTWRGEGLADDLRVEVTAGYRPWRCWMGMLSLYGLMPLASGSDASLKIAPSIAYTLWPHVGRNRKKPDDPVRPGTIQLGLSYDLLNPGDGLGLSLSIWRSF